MRSVKFYFILIIFVLSGCVRPESGVQIQNDTNADIEEAKNIFQEDERLVSTVAIFHENNIISGVTVKTFSRFHKEKIEKELKEALEKSYADFDVVVSADGKIIHETTKLFQKEDKDKEKLGKEIKKVKSLLEEET